MTDNPNTPQEEGKPVFDAERINARIFDINSQLDQAYNTGVTHALIEVLEKKRIYESIHRASRELRMLELFFDEIIAKINNLIKPSLPTETQK